MSQEETENYLTQINYSLISKAIADGKFDEANLLINEIPPKTPLRISRSIGGKHLSKESGGK
jgi:hypothetical protein